MFDNSHDSHSAHPGGFVTRVVLFLVALALASPFLAIGYFKNKNIKASAQEAFEHLKNDRYVEAKEKIDQAADSMGALYNCYVLVLPLVGGTYYEAKDIYGWRGIISTFALSERMGSGDFNVLNEIEQAERDITNSGRKFSGPDDLKNGSLKSLRYLRVMYTVHAECEKGNYQKALDELSSLSVDNGIDSPLVLLPMCYLFHQVAINFKTAEAITKAKIVIMAARKNFDHPIFVKLAIAIDPIVAPSEQPKAVSKSPSTLKEKYQQGLACIKRKDYAKAMPILEECYAHEPNSDQIAFALALIKRQQGQAKEARELCEAILARSPENEKATKLLAALNK